MPFLRTLLALSFCASLSLGAEAAKLRTLDGQTLEGDLLRISDTEIVLSVKPKPPATEAKVVATPFPRVLDLDLQGAPPPVDVKHADVELTDGTILHCEKVSLKGKEAELKLISGQEIKIPLAIVSYILNDAQDSKAREEWQGILSKKGNQDILAVRLSGVLNRIEGTFGDGDPKGESIEFTRDNGKKADINLTKVHGMAFVRKTDADMPDPLCRVHDSTRNVLMAGKVALKEGTYRVTTVAGATIELPRTQVSRLDFSKGKLTYLSDLQPMKEVETVLGEPGRPFRRDKNVDGGPLRLLVQTEPQPRSEVYGKGLAIFATTELVYDIGGQYKEFKASLGIDPTIDTGNPVKVLIEGDGRELFFGEIKRRDVRKPVVLDVKNVKQLRIVVSSPTFNDVGNHVNLADAKVSK